MRKIGFCPVSFSSAPADNIKDRLLAEVARLAPWSAETRRARGRTLFGVTGAPMDGVQRVAQALGDIADGGDVVNPPDVGIRWAFEMPLPVIHSRRPAHFLSRSHSRPAGPSSAESRSPQRMDFRIYRAR